VKELKHGKKETPGSYKTESSSPYGDSLVSSNLFIYLFIYVFQFKQLIFNPCCLPNYVNIIAFNIYWHFFLIG